MKSDDDDWDSETESLLDYLARTSRERNQNAMYPRKRSTSLQDDSSTTTVEKPVDAAQYNDLFEALVQRVRVAEDVEGQISAMRVLSRWLDDAADQLLARDSIDFHRSSEWH